MKIHPVGADLFHMDREAYRHDKDNSRSILWTRLKMGSNDTLLAICEINGCGAPKDEQFSVPAHTKQGGDAHSTSWRSQQKLRRNEDKRRDAPTSGLKPSTICIVQGLLSKTTGATCTFRTFLQSAFGLESRLSSSSSSDWKRHADINPSSSVRSVCWVTVF